MADCSRYRYIFAQESGKKETKGRKEESGNQGNGSLCSGITNEKSKLNKNISVKNFVLENLY